MYLFCYSAGPVYLDYVIHDPTSSACPHVRRGNDFGVRSNYALLALRPRHPAPYQNQVDTVTSINACNPVERPRSRSRLGGHNMAEEYLTINLTASPGLPAYDISNEASMTGRSRTRAAPQPFPQPRPDRSPDAAACRQRCRLTRRVYSAPP